MKVCKRCNRELDESCFNRSSKTKDGYSSLCKECHKESIKEGLFRKKQAKQNGANPLLKDFTSRELIKELKSRGYQGQLTYVQVIDLDTFK